MEEIAKYIEQTGWFSGELQFNLSIRRTFEGYHGRASETWETQYEVTCKEILTTDGKVLMPALQMVSIRFESFDNFIQRVKNQIIVK